MDFDDFVNALVRMENILKEVDNRGYSRRLLNKVNRIVNSIELYLDSAVDELWSTDTPLAKRRRIITDFYPHVVRLLKIVKRLWTFKTINENKITSIARIVGWFGYFDECVKLLEETIGEPHDYFSFATLADIYFELGLLDKSLEKLEKIKAMGFNFYEIFYNMALILYMIGKDQRALEVISESEKKFKGKKPMFGLKIAVAIANNDLEGANMLVLKRRGLI